MVHQLHYGHHATLSLPQRPTVQVARCQCAGTPLSDVSQAVVDALARPLNYPPLHLATTPGDRVAIALDSAVPQAQAVVAGVVRTLLRAGVEPGDVTLVVTENTEAARASDSQSRFDRFSRGDFLGSLPEAVQAEIHVETHDPNVRNRLAYLAAARDASPIYLNRQLVDADVVLPISAVTLASSLGYLGVYGGLFPLFSDALTMQRFREPPLPGDSVDGPYLKDQCDEAAWLLGALFAVQILPGPADGVLQVIAGESHEVEKQGQVVAAANWLHHTPFRASLVVATIGGGQGQQTWRNLSRALFSATCAAAENSDIVLCTQLQSIPALSPTLDRDREQPSSSRWAGGEDTVSTLVLAAARRRSRIFLLSDLESDVVEDLGMAPITDPDDIGRLSRQHATWILLQDAQHAMVAAAE